MKTLIPDHQNYEERCDDCGEFCVPFWTLCKCDRDRPIRKIDVEAILKKMEEEKHRKNKS